MLIAANKPITVFVCQVAAIIVSTFFACIDATAQDFDAAYSDTAVDDIRRAVLNRLMTDIQTIPERIQAVSGLSEPEINEVFLLLSNARSFTNDNVVANIQLMCDNWKNSSLQGQLRVEQAVRVYNASVLRNKYYINRHYTMVLLDIQNFLSAASWRSLNTYLSDRYARMTRVRSLTSSLELRLNQENGESLRARCGIN